MSTHNLQQKPPNEPKRHHYVAQGYLKGFTDLEIEPLGKMIWSYEKNFRVKKPKLPKSIKSVAFEEFYYQQEKDNGDPDNVSIENALAQEVDNHIPDIIASIKPISGKQITLDSDDQQKLAFFMGISLTRVPSFRTGMKKLYDRFAKIGLARVAQADPNIREMIEKYGVYAEAKDWVSLEPMIKFASGVAESLLNKSWQFCVPPQGSFFVTSDNPVQFVSSIPDPKGIFPIGPTHPLAEHKIHLRRDLALVCSPKSQKWGHLCAFHLSSQDLKKFNRGVAWCARKYVFSPQQSEGIYRLTQKYIGSEQALQVD